MEIANTHSNGHTYMTRALFGILLLAAIAQLTCSNPDLSGVATDAPAPTVVPETSVVPEPERESTLANTRTFASPPTQTQIPTQVPQIPAETAVPADIEENTKPEPAETLPKIDKEALETRETLVALYNATDGPKLEVPGQLD